MKITIEGIKALGLNYMVPGAGEEDISEQLFVRDSTLYGYSIILVWKPIQEKVVINLALYPLPDPTPRSGIHNLYSDTVTEMEVLAQIYKTCTFIKL